ncbi:MAG: hypothetical protein M3P27_06615 [Acidobacteriota bacterium]|nr:hypothetical protein [Acidobacteriota bacterium]
MEALREYARDVMGMASRLLSEDTDLDPIGLIVAELQEPYTVPLNFENDQLKRESCRDLVERARRLKATAIVTVFTARARELDAAVEDKSCVESSRAILVTLSGPHMRNWALERPFEIREGVPVLGEIRTFEEGVALDFLPNWP